MRSIARFADGSRVILDRLGCAHLESSDPEVPAMSFVLRVDGSPTSVWISAGGSSGDAHFSTDVPGLRPRGQWTAELVLEAFVDRISQASTRRVEAAT